MYGHERIAGIFRYVGEENAKGGYTDLEWDLATPSFLEAARIGQELLIRKLFDLALRLEAGIQDFLGVVDPDVPLAIALLERAPLS